MVDLPDDDGVGEQLVDRDDVRAQVALVVGQCAQRLDRGARHAHAAVASRAVEGAAIADEVWRDGFPVEMRDVIALEERVDGELPVDARRDAVDRIERIGLRLQRGEIGNERSEHRIDVDLGRLPLPQRRRAHEDHAVLLAGRQPHQPVRADIEAGEARLVGDAEQPALRVVGPGVIGADEGPGVAAALCHRCAAMAADIGEGAHRAVGPAHQQHRHAGHVLGDVVAGLGQARRKPHEQRLASKQRVAFARGALAV